MDPTNTGLSSPYLLGQAGTQAGRQGVEEAEVWQPHFFHSKVPRQLVGSHRPPWPLFLGNQRSAHSLQPSCPSPPLPQQIAWKAGRTSPEHHLSPRDEPKRNLPGKVEQKPAQLSPASIRVAVPHLWAFCRLHSLHNPGSPRGRLLEGGLITVEILVH